MNSVTLGTIKGNLKLQKVLFVGLLAFIVIIQFYIFTPRISIDFSPTGEWIAFTCRKGNIYDYDIDVYIVRPDGTNLQRVTHNRESYFLKWADDKGSIYIDSGTVVTHKIYILDLVDYSWQLIEPEPELVKQVTSILGTDRYVFSYPQFSPDGNRVIIGTRAQSNKIAHLFLESQDGKDFELIYSNKELRNYQWMGNQALLISEFDENGFKQPLLLDLTTRKTQIIDRPDSSTATASGFEGSNNGEMIGYQVANDDAIYIMDTQGDLLMTIEDMQTSWNWSPDDKQIVYGGRDVYIMDLATEQNRKIVENSNCLKENYSWISFDN